jgi:hypothetical protein
MSVLYLLKKLIKKVGRRTPFFEPSTKFGKATARIESESLTVNERSKKKERENEKLQE